MLQKPLSYKLAAIIIAIMFFTNGLNAQVNLSQGLMAYYPFSGNALDSSGNGNNPIFNSATLAEDRFGNPFSSYSFDGSSSFIRIPNSNSLNAGNKLSFSLWVKINAFSNDLCSGNALFNKGFETSNGVYDGMFGNAPFGNFSGINFCSTPTDTSNISFYGAGIGEYDSITPLLRTGKWYHVVFVYDNTISYLYVDNKLVSKGLPQTTFTNNYDLILGKYPTNNYFLNGALDEIRIYNRTITPDEVTALFSNCSGKNSSQSVMTSTVDASSKFISVKMDNKPNSIADSSKNEITMFTWTANSIGLPLYNGRTFIKYDVTNIPKNAIINNAKLYLFAKKTGALNGLSGSPTFGTANSVLMQKIVSPWNAINLNFSNIPAIDSNSQQELAQSSNTAQDYTVDMTNFVQDWVNDPNSNYGVMMRMKTENNPYNSMVFESAQSPDSNRRARVEICYSLTLPLPTTLKLFTAVALENNEARIIINTTNEINAAYLVIEKSANGLYFESVTSLLAKGKTSLNEYFYSDKSNTPYQSKIYYRLKMIDKDGSYRYSNVISVTFINAPNDQPFQVEVYPNPVKGIASGINVITTKEQAISISVFDINGKMLFQQKQNTIKGYNHFELPSFNNAKVGTYNVRVSSDFGVVNEKIIKSE